MRTAILVLLAALGGTAPVTADVVNCGPGVAPGVICLTGNVSDTAGGGPLVAGQVYHAGNLLVPSGQTLTIQPGAILKFQQGSLLQASGVVDAMAGAIFTSIRDDMAGGDTNGDGAMTQPAPGDWVGIVSFSGSTYDGIEVRYASNGFSLSLSSGEATLSNVLVELCSTAGLDLNADARPTVTDCTIKNCDIAVVAARADGLDRFTGNSASGNMRGDYIAVSRGTVGANLSIGPNNSLDFRPIVFCTALVVQAGATLDLQSGTVLKFGFPPLNVFGCGFQDVSVAGTLLANGVTFTALEDDAIGGDTNKDGQLSQPSPGDWGGLRFQATSDASRLENVEVFYGGRVPPNAVGPAIDLVAADITMDNVLVADSGFTGLRVNEGPSASFPTVANCTFLRNAGHAVERVPLQAVAGFSNNQASDNGRDHMQLVATGPELLDGFASIAKTNSLNENGLFEVVETIRVRPGGELAIGDGVVLKWAVGNRELRVEGTLTALGASEPIVMTPITDDAVVGDSNADGGATAPAPGDWLGIVMTSGASASVLDGVVVRYAGRQTTAGIRLSATNPTIRNTTVEFSESAGLDLGISVFGGSFPIVTGCEFVDGQRAVINAPISALPAFDANVASGNALSDHIEIVDGDVSSGQEGGGAVTIGPANGLGSNPVFVVDDDIDVPAGWVLSMLGGTIVKFDGFRTLDVDGSVQLGSLGGTVVLTSIDDDSIGGDTAKDGATQGQPGDWRGLEVSGPGSVLDDVLVRFAGTTFSAAFELTAAAMLSDVRVEDSPGDALDLNSVASPTMDGCSFERNGFAVTGVPIGALPGFSNNSASQNSGGDYLRITQGVVSASAEASGGASGAPGGAPDLVVDASQSLDGRPFVFTTDVDVLAGATLAVQQGVTFKFDGARRIDVDGTFVCSAAPGTVVFTSFTDDLAGDTNKDGNATVPAPGDWIGFDFGSGSDASVLGGARVRYAAGPALSLLQADILVLDSFIEFSSGGGLNLQNSSRPFVRRTAITDGLGRAVVAAPLDALPGFDDNTASGNALGDVIKVNVTNFSGDLVIARNNALNSDGVFLVGTSILVNAGDSLELRQGVILKWQGITSLIANGVLTVEGTGLDPVVLTTAADDEVGGDTLKDGNATTPQPGAWNHVDLNPTGIPSTVEHLLVRYAGWFGEAVRLDSPDVTVRSLRVDHSAADGIRAGAHAGDASNWVAFGCLLDGIELTNGSFDLVHATVSGSGGAGIRKSGPFAGAVRNSIAFGNSGGEVAGFVPGEVFFSNVGPAFAGIDGNVGGDPLFSDAPNGDLTPAPGSPVIDTAELSVALATVEDHREGSRVADHDLDGSAGADMGAYERAAWRLIYGGQPKVGSVLTFTAVDGPPGIAVFTLGPVDGASFVDPFGFTLFGVRTSGTLFGFARVGKPTILGLLDDLAPGTLFGVQALVRPVPQQAPVGAAPVVTGGGPLGGGGFPPGVGSFTNLYRARVLP